MNKIKNKEFAGLIREVIEHDKLALVIYSDVAWALQHVEEIRRAGSEQVIMFVFDPAVGERTDGMEQLLFQLLREKIDKGAVLGATTATWTQPA